MDEAVALAGTLRERDGLLLVVTGAGVSHASGIPTFRGTDEGAIWKRDVTEMATLAFFLEDPVESWRWYLSRFDTLRAAKPNPAHRALAALERWRGEEGGEFLLITQNIDTLHEEAGSGRLIKVHGSADRVRCPSGGCRVAAPRGSLPLPDTLLEAFLKSPEQASLPRCPECDSPLRPHVLWFDEFYDEHVDYQWNRVRGAAATAATVVFVGTSFSVGVTDLVAQYAHATGARMISIDPGAATAPYPGIETLRARAEQVLPAACQELGLEI